jgi:predicted membrane protein
MKAGNSAMAIFFWLLAFLFPGFYFLMEKYEVNSFFNYLRTLFGLTHESFLLMLFIIFITMGIIIFAFGIEFKRKKEPEPDIDIRVGENNPKKPMIKEAFPETIEELNELL